MSRRQTQLLAAALYFVWLVAASSILDQSVVVWMLAVLVGTFAAAYVVGAPGSFALPLLLIPSLYIVAGREITSSYPVIGAETIFEFTANPVVWLFMFASVGLSEWLRPS